MSRPGRSTLAALLAGAALALVVAAPARATLGSVPAEVADYVASGRMLERVEQFYGPGAAGDGIDFDDTTKTGAISRVWGWSPEVLAGDGARGEAALADATRLLNEWVVPITVADESVGVARIWINPDDHLPELADFLASPALAERIAALPAEVALVHDADRGAWFAVDATSATPLLIGSSGVASPEPLDSLELAPVAQPEAPADSGLPLAVVAVVVLVLVLAGAVALPALLARRRAAAAIDAPADPASADPDSPDPESADVSDPR